MEISTYEQTRQRAMSFINENQKVKLAELPNFSEKIKKSLLEDLRHRATYYERNDGLSRAKELIRAVQFLEGHENREGFVMATKITEPITAEIVHIFGNVSSEELGKYKEYALGMAKIIELWDFCQSKEFAFFADKDRRRGVSGGIKIVPHRATAISGLSSNGMVDEAGALIMDYISSQRGQRKWEAYEGTIDAIIKDNPFVPVLASIIHQFPLEG